MKKKGFANIELLVVGLSIGFNFLLWMLTLTLFDRTNPTAVLHYSVDLGIDFVGQGINIITLPIIGSVILVCNTALGFFLRGVERRLAWILWVTIPLVQLILLISFVLLWRVNETYVAT
jgi:hypothetical protein